jgi:hypothetical protein
MPAAITNKNKPAKNNISGAQLDTTDSTPHASRLSKTEQVKIFLANNPIPKEFLKRKSV